MKWSDVGEWLKGNAGAGVALVGSLMTGNVPGAIAAGTALVTSATGTDDPLKALEALQTDPQVMLKLKDLYYQNEDSVRQHIQTMEQLRLEDTQKQHHETQETIRNGDNATDTYVRRTRPQMARQSWNATVAYCLGCMVFYAFNPLDIDIFNGYIAASLAAPALAYMGMRTGDKFAEAVKRIKQDK